MARLISKMAGGAALLSALSMAATPVSAAALPKLSSPVTAAHVAGASAGLGVQDQEWRGRGRHHRGGGVDGGDILAGVLILGGIAAIASAASNSNKARDDYRYEEPYRDNRPVYNDGQGYNDGRGYMGNGIDNAVDICVGQVERGNDRVAAVDNAARTSDGWRISGQMDAGGNFSCWIDNDGRIRNVDVGGGYYYGASSGQSGSYSGDAQWNDSEYARAREQAGYASPGVTYDDHYYGSGG